MIFFTDNEWTGAAFNTGESYTSWTAPAADVAAGTVIAISNFTNAVAVPMTANIGTAAAVTVSGSANRGLSTGSEIVYAYTGASATAPTTFLTAVHSITFGTDSGDTLTGTGLTAGDTALQIGTSTGADIGAFNGARAGQSSFAAYRTSINNPANWIGQDAAGDQSIDLVAPDMPFSTAAFVLSATETQNVAFGTASVTLAEGNTGSTAFSFTVQRTGGTTGTVSFSGQLTSTQANSADFAGAPALPIAFSGTIAAGATVATVTIAVAGDAVVEPTEAFTLTLQAATNDNGTVTIGLGAQTTASGTILDDDTNLKIGDVQGTGHTSTMTGQIVTLTGVVTAVDTNGSRGFFIQDAGDGNAQTSDGIFVFLPSGTLPTLGRHVSVTGTVAEFTPSGAAVGSFSTTELSSVINLTDLGVGPTIAPTAIGGTGGLVPPTTDLAAGGLFYERLEGMLVTVKTPVAVGPTNGFGEIFTVVDADNNPANGLNATGLTPRGNLLLTPGADNFGHNNTVGGDFNPERIQIDDDSGVLSGFTTPTVNTGATLNDVTGVVRYDFGNYEIVATQAYAVNTASTLVKEASALTGTATRLLVAAYNAENLDPGDGATRFQTIGTEIVTRLNAPDIVALQEIQDNNGPTNDAVTAANTTLQMVVDAIAAAGGPAYAFIDNPFIGDDTNGGEPGGNIRTAYLYRTDRVGFVSGSLKTIAANGTAVTTSHVDQQTNPDNPFFGSRPPLAATFTFNGNQVTLIDNHFTSKGGSAPLLGSDQPPFNAGEVQRAGQAQAVNTFVDGLLAANATAKVMVLGDLNEFPSEEPMRVLKGTATISNYDAPGTDTFNATATYTPGGTAVLNDLQDLLPANEQFDYVFEGNSETLDHAMVSNSLLTGAQFDVVRINADFADQTSDHEPLLASFSLPQPYTLQILHFYGESGTLGAQTAPILGAMVDKFKASTANTLVLAEGDTWIPGPWLVAGADPSLNAVAGIGSTALARPDVAIMNAIGVNASALGNHEFDLGSPVVSGAIAASGAWVGAQFPFITSNLTFAADSTLRELADASLGGTGTNAFAGKETSAIKGKIAPYAVTTVNGEKIGIVGATTYDLLSKTSPNGTVPKDDANPSTSDLQEVAAYVQATVDALRATGVNKIVMVDQFDTIARNQALAPLLSGIDIMVAGGGHERLGDANDTAVGFNGHTASYQGTYPIVATDKDGNPTLIVTTDTEFSYLGRLQVSFDGNGLIDVAALNSTINGAYAANEATLQAVYGSAQTAAQIVAGSVTGAKVQAIAGAINSVVVAKDSVKFGFSNVYMEGDRVFGRAQETNLGDLTADANAFKAKLALGVGTNTAMVSLKNGGGLRASIGSIDENGVKVANAIASGATGNVSQLDVENALRFDNKMMVFDTTPQGLLNIFNFAADKVAGDGGFPQVGGLRYSYDPSLAAGGRVRNIALYDGNGAFVAAVVQNGAVAAGAPASIPVVILNFTANGGDGYPIKANGTNFRFLLDNNTLTAAVDPALDFTAVANVPANALGEQKAFEDYMVAKFNTQATAFNQADTPASGDLRIENLSARGDAVFGALNATGTAADETFVATPLNDTVNGAGGSDTVVYNVARSAATVTRTGPGAWTVTTPTGGTDTLTNVEVVKFTDSSLFTTSQTPYLVASQSNVHFASILSAGDVAGLKTDGTTPWRMAGIPDGLGAFDNGDGTITVLMNQEIGNTVGIVRASGAIGSFVSRLVIDKATLSVISGSDEDSQVFLWNSTTHTYDLSTTALSRFCSADLAPVTAYFNAATGLGTQDRIFLNGEESGNEGRPMAHIATGADKGKAFELPKFGNAAWENLAARPVASDKTVVIGQDDTTPGQVYVYIGTKTNTGTALDKAGLTNGSLYGIKADFGTEANTGTPLAGSFTLAALPDETNRTGANLQTDSVAAGVTNWLRPEDGAWDTANPNRFYFVTTNALNSPSRLWALDFVDPTDPSKGGTYTALLDGTEGQKMFDNVTVGTDGTLILQEDVGNAARQGRVWHYDPKTDGLTEIARHDLARFGDETTAATAPFTQDEESSGVIEVTGLLGSATQRAFLLDTQAHYAFTGPNAAEVVEGGQLQLMTIDTVVNGTAGNDTIAGTFIGETISGGAGDDTITPAGGADIVDGGTGSDTVVYNVARSAATVTRTGPGAWTVTTPTGGTDTLTNVEVVKFTDQNLFSIASPFSLSSYVRVGRYNLPEPTRATAPTNSLLAQEVSAVTYDWDTGTLFVVGDGGTSIVQVSLTGQLIDSMTLAPGGSPQGTDFYDPEGLAYIGGGKFVMTEERDRNAVQFTYAPGTTLNRAGASTVGLGTNVGNVGLEGLTFDKQTGEYIFVKEKTPQSIFQTGIDFVAHTATNGSPTTVNSVNLFNPTLTRLADFADVYSLANVNGLTGLTTAGHLLVLSQESARIVEVDRSGNIFSALNIASDPGNPLSVFDQQHEGMTMDDAGNLYVVSENGGGDFDHPQLWVYAVSTVPNLAPTGVTLLNQVASIQENTNTSSRIKVADISIGDDGIGTNDLSVSGADAAFFEADSSGLYIKAGTVLDFETKTSYAVTVRVDDTGVGGTPDASTPFTLSVTDVINENPAQPLLYISEVAPWSSGNSPVAADWFEVTNNGATTVDITGWKVDDNSDSFAAAVALNGVTSIGAGESIVLLETADLPAARSTFLTNWFGANPPSGLRIGSYTGAGMGLSTAGDHVNLFNATGVLQASVAFGASPAGPFTTFNNAEGLNNTTISRPSALGVNNAFAAANDPAEIGSPGSIGSLFVSEVAPWSSANSPVAADWFELRNTTPFAIDLAGWKMDDNSGSPAAAVALTGVASIAPGESVVFLETADLATAKAAFVSNWFGANPPLNLKVGAYSGVGVGLGSTGDAVNIYDADNRLRTSIVFGASPTGPFATFDNAARVNSATIGSLSAIGVNGAFAAVSHTTEIGSPGDAAPTLAISADQASKAEGNAGTTSFGFTVRRTGDLSLAASVAFVVAGKADAADFGGAMPSGAVAFAPGQATAPIAIGVSGDTLVETDETFTVTLINPAGATITGAAASATIINDDRGSGLTTIRGVGNSAADTISATSGGDTSIAADLSRGLVFQAASGSTANVNTGAAGSAGTTVFGARASNIVVSGSAGDSKNPVFVVAGDGNSTLNASASTSPVWLSVNTTVAGASGVVLTGGSGDDFLVIGGAAGTGTLTGGAGADKFVFFKQASGQGANVVADFNRNEDAVFIEGYGISEAQRAGFLANAAVSGSNVTLNLGDGATVTFLNTTRDQLSGRVHTS